METLFESGIFPNHFERWQEQHWEITTRTICVEKQRLSNWICQHFILLKLSVSTTQLVTFRPLISWVTWPSYREEDTPRSAGSELWEYLSSFWQVAHIPHLAAHRHPHMQHLVSAVSCLLLRHKHHMNIRASGEKPPLQQVIKWLALLPHIIVTRTVNIKKRTF